MSNLIITYSHEKPEEFSIVYKGLPLIKNSSKTPFLSAGIGSADYKMSHGIFSIKETEKTITPITDWTISRESESVYKLESPYFGSISIEEVNDSLVFSMNPAQPYNRVKCILQALPDEYVYGCGEQYSYLNLRGKKVPIWVQEQGIGRGCNAVKYIADVVAHGAGGNKFTTYYAMPMFVSSIQHV